MVAKAIKLINMVLKHEGGYANVKDDAGGETYRGITRKNFSSWSGWEIVDAHKPLKNNQVIDDLALDEYVRDFYYDKFYQPLKIAKIDDMLISGHLLCHGVNAGIKPAVRLLQKAINNITDANIAVDGIIGSATLVQANSSSANEIAYEFINQRNQYYKNIVARNPSQKKFLNGWLKRVENTTKTCSSGYSMLLTQNSGGDTIFTKIVSFILKLLEKFIFKKN